MIDLCDMSRTFTLHNRGSAVIEVPDHVNRRADPGECGALVGAAGGGASTPTVDVLAEPLRAGGMPRDTARTPLAGPDTRERQWSLSPTAFSGGEQPRINIARLCGPAIDVSRVPPARAA